MTLIQHVFILILLRIGFGSIILCFWLMISFCTYTHLSIYTASESGGKLEAPSTEENGFISTRLNQIKHWLLSHSQHMNFFTILVLASVSLDLLWLYYWIFYFQWNRVVGILWHCICIHVSLYHFTVLVFCNCFSSVFE